MTTKQDTAQTPEAQRFWSHVDKLGPDECWPWNTVVKQQYPEFYYFGRREGAHRIALILTVGEPPQGAHALHSCDNMKCCNPAHLRWGTHADNFKECLGRVERYTKVYPPKNGTGKRGELHPGAKLSADDVERIRQLIKTGIWQKDIAAQFQVSPTTISNIKKGKGWNHVQH